MSCTGVNIHDRIVAYAAQIADEHKWTQDGTFSYPRIRGNTAKGMYHGGEAHAALYKLLPYLPANVCSPDRDQIVRVTWFVIPGSPR